MSGDGFINRGLELIRLRGHPKFYNFVKKFIGSPELGNEQIQKFEQIGAKVGLDPSKVRVALAESQTKSSNPSTNLLKYLLLIIAIAIILIAGIWAVYWLRYPPGTLYDALAPHDFE